MAIQQKTVTIKGQDYLLTTIPAIKGVALLKQLIKLLGPSFAKFQQGNDLGGAMMVLFDNLDNVGVEQLIVNLVGLCATKDRVGINFDSEFAGEYDKLFELVKEIVEFNYGSVFTLLGSEESLQTTV